MKRRIVVRLLLALSAVLVGTVPASAAPVHARFSPADTTVAPGTAGRLSILLDDTVAVRTIEVYVTFDTTTVAAVSGGAGALYTGSGLQLFQGWEIDQPGRWHGYVVIMGPGLSVTGPGELFRWDFTGAEIGVTGIVAVEAHLLDATGVPFDEFVLPPTTIRVGDGTSGAAPVAPRRAPRLTPNPFNPRTVFALELSGDGPLHLDVLDVRGRRVADIYDGRGLSGTFRAAWDGRDDRGREVPGGVYLFRCRFRGDTRIIKGLLLK